MLLSPGLGICDELAENVELSDIIVTNTRDDLILYFRAKNFFSQVIKTAIQDGISAKITFNISFYKVRGLWPDKQLIQQVFIHTLKYNELKGEFSVVCGEHNTRSVVNAFDEAQHVMEYVDNLAIIPLGRLLKGRKYQVRIKAQLDIGATPTYLKYLMFFANQGINTNMYTIDFTY
ncbi:MAG: DUF4390 domain-containing protein [Pseudomonadota bacterium]